MTALDPFKVRRGEIDKSIAAAIRVFGQPTNLSHGYTSAEANWHFYDEGLIEYNLEIGFYNESDTLHMNIRAQRTREDQTLCGNVVGKSTKTLVRRFVEEVRKPWDEWTEDEIMERPMWVCLYKEAGNEPAPAMENMMAMLSFQSPDDKWVKRYFRGCHEMA